MGGTLEGALDPKREEEALEEFVQKLERSKSVGAGQLRTFPTGATRDEDDSKNDYEGFLSPLVLEAYGNYMTRHRRQADGSLRASDNWQLGIPKSSYQKSLWRHFLTAWKLWRGYPVPPEKVGGVYRPVTLLDALMGILFNTMGLAHKLLLEGKVEPKEK